MLGEGEVRVGTVECGEQEGKEAKGGHLLFSLSGSPPPPPAPFHRTSVPQKMRYGEKRDLSKKKRSRG